MSPSNSQPSPEQGPQVPLTRISVINDSPIRTEGTYVLYWMTAARRTRWSFAFDRAVAWAKSLGKPLLVMEALRANYPFASDRIHSFVIQGMADQQAALSDTEVGYFPYVEPEHGASKGLLACLAKKACLVIGDQWPCLFHPNMQRAASRQINARFEIVDGNGILPLSQSTKPWSRAFDFRRHLQRELPSHFSKAPNANALTGVELAKFSARMLPAEIKQRWPKLSPGLMEAKPAELAKLPIDHQVQPTEIVGGMEAGAKRLSSFIQHDFDEYVERRNHPLASSTSGLSPYLHFGHVGAHQVFASVMRKVQWSPNDVAAKPTGKNSGWWNSSENAEAFLDQVITWRELGHVFNYHRDDYDKFESLPDWAKKTLQEHAPDPREEVYDLETLMRAETADPIWNAAQTQLVREGFIHNYLRMLWGKKILQWTKVPEQALEFMIHLNDRFALDGRDPNSYSGIFWVLGRFDRAWGPERPIFGKVRYMTSESTRRKLPIQPYLDEYGAD